MEPISATTIARPGEKLPVPSGIPLVFTEHINRLWCLETKGSVSIVRLHRPSRAAWVQLGNSLMSRLLATAHYAGLCVDGHLPLDAALVWVEAFAQAGTHGYADMKLMSPEALATGASSLNITLIAFQRIQAKAWMQSFWDTTDSQWFNFGCDLLVAMYADDVVSGLVWDFPLDIDMFARTVGRSTGWLIPTDGYAGYIVGWPGDPTANGVLGETLQTVVADVQLSGEGT